MTGFASAFTTLRTGERCDDANALLAAMLADAADLGLGRGSHGVTRDKLIGTDAAYIRPGTLPPSIRTCVLGQGRD